MVIEDMEMRVQGVPKLGPDTAARYRVEADREAAADAIYQAFGRPMLPEFWVLAEIDGATVLEGYRRSGDRLEAALDRMGLDWTRVEGRES